MWNFYIQIYLYTLIYNDFVDSLRVEVIYSNKVRLGVKYLDMFAYFLSAQLLIEYLLC